MSAWVAIVARAVYGGMGAANPGCTPIGGAWVAVVAIGGGAGAYSQSAGVGCGASVVVVASSFFGGMGAANRWIADV